jgi:hypothetical protein
MGHVDIRFTKEEAEKLRDIVKDIPSNEMILLTHALTVQLERLWDENRDQDAPCLCGHSYYRHFDSWDGMEPIGCKYCECWTFKE